jgi:C1A family cysteine protease
MKGRRVFSLLAVILSLLIFLQTMAWSDRLGQVEAFRGARLEGSVLNPLISTNLNMTDSVKVSVNGTAYDSENGELLLNSDMQVLASFALARNIFYCSARLYDDKKIDIERNDDSFSFYIGKKTGTKNGEKYDLSIAPKIMGDKVYMSLKDLCLLFGYGYSWDKTEKTANLDSTPAKKPVLRSSYDLRSAKRVSKIKNQGSLSTCWAYAAASALESSLLPEEYDTFSPKDMSERNTYGIPADKPGNYMMAVSYMLSWTGPVEDDTAGTAKHVQEVHFYSQDDMDDIKWAVFKNGGVSTSLFAETNTSDLSGSDYYNADTNSYYYYGQKEPNHDVLIIGWDDNYSKDNFKHSCPGNGAFICQNSWGDKFGDNGVFYVSYYDTNIGQFGVSYVKIENNTNYDRIYQTDLCGEIGSAGYKSDKAYGANVYTASSDENLKSCGFYTTSKDTSYNVYVVSDYSDTGSLSNKVHVASGKFHDVGYYTVPFNKDIAVNDGQRFAVVVEFISDKKGNQIPIEYDGNVLTKNVKIDDGEGYISSNGLNWARIETDFNANICLKVYADDKK